MVIRTIYNMAMKEDPDLIGKYPFGKGKVKIKFPDSLKIGLSSEDVKLIETTELPRFTRIDHARNIWLFAFYFAGMRYA